MIIEHHPLTLLFKAPLFTGPVTTGLPSTCCPISSAAGSPGDRLPRLKRFRVVPILRALCVMLLCGSPALLLVGCSKRQEAAVSSSAPSLFDRPIAAYVPGSALGVVIAVSDSQGAELVRRTPWGGGQQGYFQQIFDRATQSSPDDARKIKVFLEAARKAGIGALAPDQKSSLREYVLFGGVQPNSKVPEFGIYAFASAGADSTVVAASFKSAFVEEHFKVTEESFAGGGRGYSVAAADAGAVDTTFYVGALKDRLAVTSSRALTEAFLTDTKSSWIQEVRKTEAFKVATRDFTSGPEQFAVAYVDLNRGVRTITELIPADTRSQVNASNLPIDSIAFEGRFKDTLTYRLACGVAPRNPDQKGILTQLVAGSEQGALLTMPQGGSFYLTVNGQVFRSLRNALLKESQVADAMKIYEKELSLIDSIENVGFSVRNARAGSPFPDILLSAKSSRAAELQTLVKEKIVSGVAQSGMQGMSFLTKQVKNVPTSYMNSPLGVGVYLAVSGGNLLATSSELALEDQIEVSSGKTSFVSSLSPNSQKVFSTAHTLGAMHIDYGRGVELVEGVQGSFAMFTGGQAMVDRATLDEFRKLGTLSGSVAIQDGLLSLVVSADPPSAVR